jgi:hypothetical protein
MAKKKKKKEKENKRKIKNKTKKQTMNKKSIKGNQYTAHITEMKKRTNRFSAVGNIILHEFMLNSV